MALGRGQKKRIARDGEGLASVDMLLESVQGNGEAISSIIAALQHHQHQQHEQHQRQQRQQRQQQRQQQLQQRQKHKQQRRQHHQPHQGSLRSTQYPAGNHAISPFARATATIPAPAPVPCTMHSVLPTPPALLNTMADGTTGDNVHLGPAGTLSYNLTPPHLRGNRFFLSGCFGQGQDIAVVSPPGSSRSAGAGAGGHGEAPPCPSRAGHDGRFAAPSGAEVAVPAAGTVIVINAKSAVSADNSGSSGCMYPVTNLTTSNPALLSERETSPASPAFQIGVSEMLGVGAGEESQQQLLLLPQRPPLPAPYSSGRGAVEGGGVRSSPLPYGSCTVSPTPPQGSVDCLPYHPAYQRDHYHQHQLQEQRHSQPNQQQLYSQQPNSAPPRHRFENKQPEPFRASDPPQRPPHGFSQHQRGGDGGVTGSDTSLRAATPEIPQQDGFLAAAAAAATMLARGAAPAAAGPVRRFRTKPKPTVKAGVALEQASSSIAFGEKLFGNVLHNLYPEATSYAGIDWFDGAFATGGDGSYDANGSGVLDGSGSHS